VLSRVKLPKSFLAVNLSENHTFHKKEDGTAEGVQGLTAENANTDEIEVTTVEGPTGAALPGIEGTK